MRALIIITLLSLQACAILNPQKPTMDNIGGEWESTSLGGYTYLSINGENDSFIIMVPDNEEPSVAKLSSFELLEREFKVRLVPINEPENTDTLYGTVFENRLFLKEEKTEKLTESIFSFMRVGEVERLRPLAKKALEEVKNNEHNKRN